MANYICTSRTNYFRVTDEERYKELFSHLVGGEDDVKDFTMTLKDVTTIHGFGCYSDVYYSTGDDDDDIEYNLDGFIDELKKILPEGEAFIYMSTGYEKLRYVAGWGIVATRDKDKFIDLEGALLDAAREMLGDENFKSKCCY